MGARYSRQTGYTITRRSRHVSSRNVQRRVKFGPTTAKLFGLIALTVLAIVMVSQSSGRATNAYKQNALRREESQIQQDIERLRLEAQRAQSLQAVQQTAVKEGMEPVKEVEFIEKGDVAGASTEQQP
jgi:hypothetical protein